MVVDLILAQCTAYNLYHIDMDIPKASEYAVCLFVQCVDM